MKRKISFFTLLLASLLLFIQTVPVHADENDKPKQQEHSFTVNALLPKNQITNKESFYDLKVEPNQKQTLKFIVSNIGTKSTKVTVKINDAYTSMNGIISYDRDKVELYKSQNPNLTSLITSKRKRVVKLKPNESQTVTFTYQAPAEPFKGMILGGISATADVGEASDEGKLSIKNRVQYVTGVVLRSNPDEAVEPHVTMGKKVAGMSRSMQSGVGFDLYNSAPTNVSRMRIKADFERGGKKYFTYKMNNLQMAPNSIWHEAFIPFKKLEAGSYKMTLNVYSKTGYKKTFVRKFTITKEQSQKIKKSTEPKRYNRVLPWLFLCGILAVVLGLVYLLWVYMKGKNNSEHN